MCPFGTENPQDCNPLLEVRGVSKCFGDLWALRELSVVIGRGETVAFVGPNGAGKTTLFHVIAGCLEPDEGRVLLEGGEITGLPAWRVARLGVGRQFQEARIFRNLTVLENLLVALAQRDHGGKGPGLRSWYCVGHRSKEHREEARDCLDFAGLCAPENLPAGALSLGQRRQLVLAQLLASRARLVLLDEPSAGLAPQALEQVLTLVRRMIEERDLTVALVEHNMEVVSRLAGLTYFMYQGQVSFEGPTSEVLEQPEVRALYLGASHSRP